MQKNKFYAVVSAVVFTLATGSLSIADDKTACEDLGFAWETECVGNGNYGQWVTGCSVGTVKERSGCPEGWDFSARGNSESGKLICGKSPLSSVVESSGC